MIIIGIVHYCNPPGLVIDDARNRVRDKGTGNAKGSAAYATDEGKQDILPISA